jgi:hypothetical protein
MTTLIEKEKFLNNACEKDYILFYEHDPVAECSTIELTEKGFKRKDLFNLDAI